MDDKKYRLAMNLIVVIANICVLGICAWLSYKFNNLWLMLITLVYHFKITNNDKESKDRNC